MQKNRDVRVLRQGMLRGMPWPISEAGLRRRENFRKLKMAAETGMDLSAMPKKPKRAGPATRQMDLFDLKQFKPKPKPAGPKLSGYVPPHIARIAKNRAELEKELGSLRADLARLERSQNLKNRGWMNKQETTDEMREIRAEIILVESLIKKLG